MRAERTGGDRRGQYRRHVVSRLHHRAGDGFIAGAGDNEIATVTVEADTIDAGIGDDFIHADAGNDSIITGAGADLVLAAAGADTVSGGDGVDTIRGGQGADSLIGAVGNDLFLIETASDIDGLAESIDGGTDFDELNFTNFNAFGPIDLSAATITGIERLANSEVGGGHAFAFLGGDGFTGVAGQLRYSAGNLLGDIDGDSVAEFQIAIPDRAGGRTGRDRLRPDPLRDFTRRARTHRGH